MSVYVYRCDEDGPVELTWPIGTAPDVAPCPTCGAEATRRFTAPMLGFADRGRMATIDRAEASRTEPTVVSSPPPRSTAPRRQPRLDPRTAKLPRP